ncbi:hypothetical protein RM572_00735 [Streptomyces sp. DSM 42041]|uniref:30S ribosomal protein S18 n=1 Tax=Streptomyces hazeniae TaxID=3075538 RepID=A0ABU2NL14_9ACTN|nr:hypothetical protein [Streptomyces sp. DSM 42041]MDT0377301.1 hypothetical protein [Streptomyces sp. DSM 42041]
MTATCRMCKRLLKRPSPDGLGPKCRRKRRDRLIARARAQGLPIPAGYFTDNARPATAKPRRRRTWNAKPIRTLRPLDTYQTPPEQLPLEDDQ